ncbi:MAG: insulinase family protein [Candidatus Omnitrophota bacterium]|jgi:predicted Zn-dependent peptidase|nr:MAG: insulinase family protein [Candidatus Omnitrophota bacterium]
MHKKTVLANGLKIVAEPMSHMQSVAFGIWIKVGGRYENPSLKGISHFIEHLLFKGSRRYSCRRIKESIEGVGGALNGFTSEELTCYLVKIPKQYLSVAMDILSDMVLHPLLPPEEMKKERTVILEEIKMYKDLPQYYVYDLLDKLLWPDQPLGMSIAGTEESVLGIQRQDIREYKETYYTARNILLSVAGSYNYDVFMRYAQDRFGSLTKKATTSFARAREGQKKPGLHLLRKDTEQTHLALGFHGVSRTHPLRFAVDLLHILLGANMSSRLFNELREKRGLAYEIGSQVKRFEDTGAFVVHAGIDTSKLKEAVSVILSELHKIKLAQVKASELKRAKDFYLGQLELALEDTLDRMLWIGESVITQDKVYTLEEIIKEIRYIKANDVREAARFIFREEKLNLAVIGPVKESREDLERICRI